MRNSLALLGFFMLTSMALSRFLAKVGGTFAILCEVRLHFRDFLQSSVALSRFLAKFISTFAIFSKIPWHFRDFMRTWHFRGFLRIIARERLLHGQVLHFVKMFLHFAPSFSDIARNPKGAPFLRQSSVAQEGELEKGRAVCHAFQ